MTFLAALRCDRIEAPFFVLDGPINGEWFLTYVQQVLIPTLSHGDLVIMDKLGSHKGEAVRRSIRTAGAHLLFLPPYSPDLNPIEQLFNPACCDAMRPSIRPLNRTQPHHTPRARNPAQSGIAPF